MVTSSDEADHAPTPPPEPQAASTLAATRGVLAGIAVLLLGGGISGALMLGNLRIAPALPLFLPATAVFLWGLWWYAGGGGWPRRTALRRRQLLRSGALSLREWLWALLAGALGVVAVMGVAFVTYQHAVLPEAAYRAPFEVASFPPWTVVSIFAAVALTAGVVEEVAFRGCMLSAIAGRFGWITGIVTVTLLFYLAHLSHAYATLAFLPFFLGHGLVFGLLVYFTRSITPGVILHALSDFVVLPMQYGVVASIGRWLFVANGWMSLLAAALAAAAFMQLARITAARRDAR